MNVNVKLWLSLAIGWAGAAMWPATVSCEDAKKQEPAAAVSYYKQIRPIFQAHCQGCHQPAKPGGKYVMTTFDRLRAGGESGIPAIVPGKPDESYLVEQITPENGQAIMPKGKAPLSAGEIELVRKWIAEGAADDTPVNALARFDAEHPPVYTMPPVITSLDFSPDPRAPGLLAVAGFHEVLLHNADGSGLVARLVGLSERIESVRFSPDGKLLAVTGGLPVRMGEVQVWDVEKRRLALSVPVTFDTVYGASWSPDGKLIAFGCSDNTVRAIDATTGEQVFFQGSHNDWVLDTVFSVKGDHLISVGRDRTAKLTEFATQRFIDNITSITPGALKGGIDAVERHPANEEILVGGADGAPKLYRIFRTTKRVIGDDANLIREFPPLKGRIFDVAISRDGRRIAAGSSLDGTGEVRIYAYDFDTGVPDEIKKVMMKTTMQQTPEEKQKLADYSRDGVKIVAQTSIDSGGVYAVAFHPDGGVLAAAGSDGIVRLISSDSGSVLKEFMPAPIDARTAASASSPSSVAAAGGSPPAPQPAEPESLPDGAKLVALDVQPPTISLTHESDAVQLVVAGRLESGATVDVTRLAKIQTSDAVADISPSGVIRPKADGLAKLTISVGGHTAKVPLVVAMHSPDARASYVRDVMPVLSKLGCNAGTCHGAKEGKAGFKLSLRGYDPIFDVRAFTDDHASRRVNLASPDDSLMLLKATGAVPHTAGQPTRPGEPYYEILRRWIAQGAKLDLAASRVTAIDIFPKNPIVQQIGGKQQMRILATYADGEVRDVTAESFVESGNTDIAKTDRGGLVTTLRRGEAPVLARFEGKYAATTLTVMGERAGFVWQDPPVNNYVDELVWAKLKRMKILPSELSSDAEFIRRVYLDLTGLPPTADDVRNFLADPRDTRVKRDELIDRLIGSPDYVEHWTNKWADLLQVNGKFLGSEGAAAFRQWIREQVAANTPYDQFVRKILMASGSNRENPPASYFKILRTPDATMENTTHLFLAIRFNCNKCHDHPFERWTQDQYYQTAAFFAQFGLKKDDAAGDKTVGGTAVEGAKPLYEVVFDQNQGEVKHDRTGEITAPAFPFVAASTSPETAGRRERLAGWITSPDNAYFARSYVNRIWGYLTGVGLIEPLDDIRAGNPPTNPELLERLTRQFIDSGFNVQDLIRTITKSRTYQLSIKTNPWNEDDQVNYSHATARRLPAEVFYDALHRVTGSVSKIPGVPPGTRAAALPDAGIELPSRFLANMGRPPRESACECERTSSVHLGPVMALISGPTVGDAVADPENDIAKLVAAERDDAKLIDGLFLRVLNRPATKPEIDASLQIIAQIPGEHDKLVAELAEYEKSLVPIVAEREQKRQERIVQTKAALEAYEREIAPREAELDRLQLVGRALLDGALAEYEKTLPQKLAAWEERQKQPTVWVPLDPSELAATNGSKLEKQPDLSVFASGSNGKTNYKFVAPSDLAGITGVKLELFADDRLPAKGPGRAANGNFVLTEFRAQIAPKATPNDKRPVVLQNAQADFSQQNYDVATAIDGKDEPVNNGWASAPMLGVNRTAVFETKEDIGSSEGAVLTFTLDQKYADGQHSIGRFRLSVTTSPRPVRLDGLPPNIAAIVAVAADQRNDEQKAELMKFFRSVDPELKKHEEAVADSKKPRPIDPKLKELRDRLETVSQPLPIDPKLAQLRHDVELSGKQLQERRLVAAQDVAWALINSPAFLFNR